MSLVWHIVRKDFRRLRLPLVLWLVLVLAHTGLLLLAGGRPEDPPNPVSYQSLGYFAGTWGVIVASVGFVLAAWLVMEDSLVVTQAFWPTRPISGGRLLAAKMLGALLMFSVAPVLVLVPVWLGCGFSWPELARAAWLLAASQALISVGAFLVAGVTQTSGQFLMRAVGAVILLPLGVGLAMENILPPEDRLATGLVISRFCLVGLLLVVTPLLVVVHQYLTRRTSRSWLIGLTGFGLMLSVRFVWFWDISALVQPGRGHDGKEPAEVSAIVTVIQGTGLAPAKAGTERAVISLRGGLSGVQTESYVRINASFAEWLKAGGEGVPTFRRLRAPAGAGRPTEPLLRQLAGLPAPSQAEAAWLIEGDELADRAAVERAAANPLRVALNLTLMRGHRLGELPLQVGAELRAGACRTRIIGIERVDTNVIVRLEERDAAFADSDGLPDWPAARGRSSEDGFVMVNRAMGLDQVPDLRPVGSVQINSILVGQRELVLTPPTRVVNGQTEEMPHWMEDAVLIQVRFQPEIDFIRHLTVAPFGPAQSL